MSKEHSLELQPIVTLDGPAGVGKSTIAKLVAESLSLPYLDTGAMFRTLALKLGPDAAELDAYALEKKCVGLLFSLEGSGRTTRLICNSKPVGGEIRTEEIGLLAAQLGALAPVRKLLLQTQRSLGENNSLVAEGRDMGTMVFPKAQFKFFLDASPEVRALRRMRDLESRGLTVDLGSLTEQIRQRDSLDRNRELAPLRPAADALIIDTSFTDIHGVLGRILSHIDHHGGLGQPLPG